MRISPGRYPPRARREADRDRHHHGAVDVGHRLERQRTPSLLSELDRCQVVGRDRDRRGDERDGESDDEQPQHRHAPQLTGGCGEGGDQSVRAMGSKKMRSSSAPCGRDERHCGNGQADDRPTDRDAEVTQWTTMPRDDPGDDQSWVVQREHPQECSGSTHRRPEEHVEDPGEHDDQRAVHFRSDECPDQRTQTGVDHCADHRRADDARRSRDVGTDRQREQGAGRRRQGQDQRRHQSRRDDPGSTDPSDGESTVGVAGLGHVEERSHTREHGGCPGGGCCLDLAGRVEPSPARMSAKSASAPADNVTKTIGTTISSTTFSGRRLYSTIQRPPSRGMAIVLIAAPSCPRPGRRSGRTAPRRR